MENRDNQTSAVSVWTSSSAVKVTSAESIVAIRKDREHYPRYKDIPVKDRQRWLAKQFFTLASIARMKEYTADEATIGAVALDERIMDAEVLANLTAPEIEYAFKNGVFGAYGEYYGLNAISLYNFLEEFVKSEKKQESARLIREEREKQIRDEDEEYRARIRAEMEEAKRNGTFVPTGRFDFGRASKSVNEVLDTKEHKERIARQAQDILSGRIKI